MNRQASTQQTKAPSSEPERAKREVVLAVSMFLSVFAVVAVIALLVRQRNDDAMERAFDREAEMAFDDIEREIERHLDVVDDVSVFADATWPGDINEWRRYLDGRVTGGNYLAFTSTAGLVARIPADQLEGVLERERLVDPTFAINEPVPVPPGEDRLVLIRNSPNDGLDVRGIDLTAPAAVLNLDLPQPGERVLVASIDTAPILILDILGVDQGAFVDDEIHGTNLLFVQPVGEVGAEARGWVVVPADLGYLIANAVGELETDLAIAVRVPDAEIEGDLGRYDGAEGVALEDARFSSVRTIDLGGWTWSVEMWTDGTPQGLVRPEVVLVIGTAIAVAVAMLAENRRRHAKRLVAAHIEVSLQRSLAETDHLTGLLNRQGLASLRPVDHASENALRARGTVFFIDLDGFKVINDVHGHAVGDEVLVAVAHAIRSVARQHDTAIRLGGDEFLVVCPGLVDPDVAQERTEQLGRAIAEIQQPVEVRASLGLAIATQELANELEALIAEADASMYRNKSLRRSGRVPVDNQTLT